MAVTEPVPYVFPFSMGVYTSIKEESVYFRQIPRGNIVLGGGPSGPADADTRRASVLPANTVAQMAQFRRMVPAMRALHVIRVWSGVESYLPDSTQAARALPSAKAFHRSVQRSFDCPSPLFAFACSSRCVSR